ncbi:ABC transporter ATP-binding protein [Ectobacillus panaciterrae]|uniref:ABC transporter ATP-binding protein n=1 Tax=Ectobacillus panaciterrae TaxID=363872 RepID=UPI00042A7C31|nr:ABC transporter ATP-binding protein [Ectobacillus panaciterrae]
MSITVDDIKNTETAAVDNLSSPNAPVLQISDLTIASVSDNGKAANKLVQGVNLSIRPGEMLGLVGESGSGKSMTASAVLGLLPKSLQVTEGHIYLNDIELGSLSEKERRCLRGKEVAYIFQNYQGSFTPFLKIGKQLVEAIRSHEQVSFKEAKETALEWLHRVQLPADRVYGSYPFQLSGGQLQRASLAAALMMKPSLIIADEPTTALDVLTSEQVLDLLVRLQKETNCAVLLISHDLTHVLKRTDRMAVMYGGSLIEAGPTEIVRQNAQHPYTQLLLQARPLLTACMPEKLKTIPGDPGAVADKGCPFALRCPSRIEQCAKRPAMNSVGEIHSAACHVINGGGSDHEAAVGSQTNQQIVHS